MHVSFIGGTGNISSAVSERAARKGIELWHLLRDCQMLRMSETQPAEPDAHNAEKCFSADVEVIEDRRCDWNLRQLDPSHVGEPSISMLPNAANRKNVQLNTAMLKSPFSSCLTNNKLAGERNFAGICGIHNGLKRLFNHRFNWLTNSRDRWNKLRGGRNIIKSGDGNFSGDINPCLMQSVQCAHCNLVCGTDQGADPGGCL